MKVNSRYLNFSKTREVLKTVPSVTVKITEHFKITIMTKAEYAKNLEESKFFKLKWRQMRNAGLPPKERHKIMRKINNLTDKS